MGAGCQKNVLTMRLLEAIMEANYRAVAADTIVAVCPGDYADKSLPNHEL
jgi:hypothetical protein